MQYKWLQSEVKDGPAIMPCQYKEDRTFSISDWARRDNSRITHFSLLVLATSNRKSLLPRFSRPLDCEVLDLARCFSA